MVTTTGQGDLRPRGGQGGREERQGSSLNRSTREIEERIKRTASNLADTLEIGVQNGMEAAAANDIDAATKERQDHEEMVDSDKSETTTSYEQEFPALAMGATVRNKRTVRGSPVQKANATSDTSTSTTSANSTRTSDTDTSTSTTSDRDSCTVTPRKLQDSFDGENESCKDTPEKTKMHIEFNKDDIAKATKHKDQTWGSQCESSDESNSFETESNSDESTQTYTQPEETKKTENANELKRHFDNKRARKNNGGGRGNGRGAARLRTETISTNLDKIDENEELETSESPQDSTDGDTTETDDDEISDEQFANSSFATPNKNNATGHIKSKGTKVSEDNQEANISEKIDNKKFITGILFSKIGPSAQKDVYSTDIIDVMGQVFKKDINAIILPHNRSKVGAMDYTKFMRSQGMDYAKFLNLQMDQWGAPTEGKTKTAYSFYVASDVIEEDLKILREDKELKQILADQSIQMSTHKLHQSCDAMVGWFLGKTQFHTHRTGMEDRLQAHLQESQAKCNLKNEGKPTVIPPGYNMPPPIPIAVRNRTHVYGETTADVVAIFVGKADENTINALLQEYPFPLVTIIPQNCKKHHGEEWNKRLELHNSLVSGSTAVKITDANSIFSKLLIEEVIRDAQASSKIIDVAKKRSNAQDDIIHVQFLKDYKDGVLQWLNDKISYLVHTKGLKNHPKIASETDQSTKSTWKTSDRKKPSAPPPPPLTKFEHLLTQPKYSETKKSTTVGSVKQRRNRQIPAAIIIGPRPSTSAGQQPKSYSQAAQAENSVTTQSNSSEAETSLGSPDRSTTSTVKTQREMQLEKDLKSVTDALETSQKVLSETQNALVTTQNDLKSALEANEIIKEEMNQAIAAMKNKMENQEEQTRLQSEKQTNMEASFNHQLEEQSAQMERMQALMQQFMATSHQQNHLEEQITTPVQHKKRLDTKGTPLGISTAENIQMPATAPPPNQRQFTFPAPYQQPYPHYNHQGMPPYHTGMSAQGMYHQQPGMQMQHGFHDQHFSNPYMPPQTNFGTLQGPLPEGGSGYQ